MIPMKSFIYRLTSIFCMQDQPYPKDLEIVEIGYFSSKRRAERGITSLRLDEYPLSLLSDSDCETGDVRYRFIAYKLEELRRNSPIDFHGKDYLYDKSGRLHGAGNFNADDLLPFYGRDPRSCQYREGEIVEYLSHNNLDIGIIAAGPVTVDEAIKINTPRSIGDVSTKIVESLIEKRGGSLLDQSDDVYLILNGPDNFEHDHVPEYEIFPLTGKPESRVEHILNKRYRAYCNPE